MLANPSMEYTQTMLPLQAVGIKIMSHNAKYVLDEAMPVKCGECKYSRKCEWTAPYKLPTTGACAYFDKALAVVGKAFGKDNVGYELDMISPGLWQYTVSVRMDKLAQIRSAVCRQQ